MTTLRIDTPAVFAPLLHNARYKGAYGGRASGKSHHFAESLIERCLMRQGTRWVCIREIQRSLEQSVKRLIEDKIEKFSVGDKFRVLTTHIETPGNGVIIFQGMQNHTAESVKSLEGYDGAWIEEAQSLSQRSLDLLRPTIRKTGSEIWCSWNPRYPTDPIDALLRGEAPPDGAIVVRALYRDNPWLPDVLKPEIARDRQRQPDKYAHVWMGEYERHAEARVFRNWRVEPFESPSDATWYYGADWGFAVDPTVLVKIRIDGRTLYIDNEVYRVGCEIDQTPALFDSLDHRQARQWRITADSARPETISYLQRNGYPRIVAAKKGAGSVEEGVTFLQSFDIIVHPRCIHAIDELTLYAYKTDSLTGAVLPVLLDAKNHVIDACRYAIEATRGSTGAAFGHLQGF